MKRATTSTGAVVDNPSAADVEALVSEVARSGRDAFLTVERRGDRRGEVRSRAGEENYLQAVHRSDGWFVEVRAGGTDRHFGALVTDVSRVCAAFISWAAGGRDWYDLPWQQLPRAAWRSGEGTRGDLAGAV